MKYFIDTEFIEDGETIDLLSIGVVAEDGRELYLENVEADLSKANPWVQENVLPHLRGGSWRVPRSVIAAALDGFTCDGDDPEFWSWCSAYDWVVICQLYGSMIDKPAGWPSYCCDLQQELDRGADGEGISDDELPPHPGDSHNALADARWHKAIYDWVTVDA